MQTFVGLCYVFLSHVEESLRVLCVCLWENSTNCINYILNFSIAGEWSLSCCTENPCWIDNVVLILNDFSYQEPVMALTDGDVTSAFAKETQSDDDSSRG